MKGKPVGYCCTKQQEKWMGWIKQAKAKLLTMQMLSPRDMSLTDDTTKAPAFISKLYKKNISMICEFNFQLQGKM